MRYQKDRQARLADMATDLETRIKELLEQQEAVQAKQREVNAYAECHLALLTTYEETIASSVRPPACEPARDPAATLQPLDLQTVAGKMGTILETMKVDRSSLADALAKANPTHGAMVLEMDANMLQALVRHATGAMATKTTDALMELAQPSQPAHSEKDTDLTANPPTVAEAVQTEAAPETPTNATAFGPAKAPNTTVRSEPHK